MIEDGIKAGLKAFTPPGVRDPQDAGKAASGGHRIETPTSWCKGNLPLHGKQLLNRLTGKDINHGVDEATLERGIKLGEAMLDRRMGQKAMTSTGSGTGDELVPTDLSSELQRRLYLASNLVSFLAPREVNMPTNPYEYPLTTTRPTFYLEATENTAKTASDVGTGKPTLTAKTMGAKVLVSYELDEDSLIPVLPMIQQSLGDAAADAMEDAIMNGDSTATHMDTDTEAVAKHVARAWKGLRRLSIGVTGLDVDISSGGLSIANIAKTLKAMGKYAIKTDDVAIIVGVKTWNGLLGMTDLLTVDKAGQRATLFNGAVIPTLFGCPVIVSARCREDVTTTGVNGASGNTLATFTTFHRPSFLLGRRRDFTVETDRDISVQQTVIVASFRKAFTPMETPSATLSMVATARNYTA